MRRRNHLQTHSVLLAYRRLSRLITLAAVALVAIVLLSSQARNRIAEEEQELAPEVIQTALAPSPFSELGTGVFVAEGPPVDETADNVDEPPKAEPPADDRPQVNREVVDRVLDKTTRIPPVAYWHLVNLAVDTPLEVLRKHAHPEAEIGFAHLRTDPQKHRGELIHLSGKLRALKKLDATNNEKLNPHRLTALYQGDVITPATHPNPYILVMTEIPEGLALGTDLSEQVTFVGFFLKQWRYKTATVDRAAPLLIGRMVKWTPAPVIERNSGEAMIWTLIGLSMVMVAGVTAWAVRRWLVGQRRQFGLDGADEADPTAVKADLAQLERNERAGLGTDR